MDTTQKDDSVLVLHELSTREALQLAQAMLNRIQNGHSYSLKAWFNRMNAIDEALRRE